MFCKDAIPEQQRLLRLLSHLPSLFLFVSVYKNVTSELYLEHVDVKCFRDALVPF